MCTHGRMTRAAACLVATVALALTLAGAASAAGGTVFYSGEDAAGFKEAKPHATWALRDSEWRGPSRCNTSNAVPDTGGKPITTLAGFSLGRLGAVYYLSRAQGSPARLDRLRYVLLLDPGSFGEFSGGCDDAFNIDRLLAAWLARNRANRLVIVAGRPTLEPPGTSLFLGVRSYYLRQIARQGLGAQTLVCMAERDGVPYDHGDVIRSFASMIGAGAPSSCPRGLYGFRADEHPYANRIVQWNAQKGQKTAWLVGGDGKRRWIPDVATFDCIKRRAGRPWPLMASVLDRLPDLRGQRASCGTVPVTPSVPADPSPAPDAPGAPGPSGGSPSVQLAQGPAAPFGFRYAVTLAGFAAGETVGVTCHDSADPQGFYGFQLVTDAAGSAFTQSQCYSGDGPEHWVVAGGLTSNRVSWGGGGTPPPPPPARTWSEQQGSLGANTFTNPYNASGMGVKIAPYQWVEVACKVHAPQIVSANPDGYWYRIASPPWSNAYYAVANTFWNGDVPGQRPYTHNTDWAVPDC